MRSRPPVAELLLLLVGLPGSAYAYLDPGTGSLIIQGAIAAVGAVLVAGRLYWYKLKNLFKGSKSRQAKKDQEDSRSAATERADRSGE